MNPSHRMRPHLVRLLRATAAAALAMRYRRAYDRLVDGLRARRARPGWKPEHDRADLAVLQDLYPRLAPQDQEQVEGEGWRSWPDLHEQRVGAE